MKTVFFGTPAVAVPFLNLLCEKQPPLLVITRADSPSGRGLKLTPGPVKVAALERGIAVATPGNSAEIARELAAVKPDLAVVVAYGRLLKNDALYVPSIGCINIHFSLLPKYRGAAPVQRALMNGETETGVTSFWLDEGMDTGPVCVSEKTQIAPDDNAASLMDKLVSLGLVVLDKTLSAVAAGNPPRIPQSGEASFAPLLKTSEAFLDFSFSAARLHNKVRGLALGPHARVYTVINGRKTLVQVLKTSLAPSADAAVKPGAVARVERGKGFVVQCIDGALLVEAVRPEGKKSVPAWDFANGFQLKAGDMFAV
ncbi:MAG: methionyl-tRNA formyltransferase [Elusimicrobiales bacterium]|nr:methionyl-tRNA formyltransferase [Elusimicrobiales bacterium]